MMSFDGKGSVYNIYLTKKLNWHERYLTYLKDKENDTRNTYMTTWCVVLLLKKENKYQIQRASSQPLQTLQSQEPN